jgi:hypothetical protein
MFENKVSVGDIVKMSNVEAFTVTKIINLPGQYIRVIGVGYQGVLVSVPVNKSGTVHIWE